MIIGTLHLSRTVCIWRRLINHVKDFSSLCRALHSNLASGKSPLYFIKDVECPTYKQNNDLQQKIIIYFWHSLILKHLNDTILLSQEWKESTSMLDLKQVRQAGNMFYIFWGWFFRGNCIPLKEILDVLHFTQVCIPCLCLVYISAELCLPVLHIKNLYSNYLF